MSLLVCEARSAQLAVPPVRSSLDTVEMRLPGVSLLHCFRHRWPVVRQRRRLQENGHLPVLPSLHNHTRWSDGSDTLSAYINTARSLGVNELGISDHYTLSPYGPRPAWSMRLDCLDAYVRDIVATTGERRGVTVRLGIEADFFPETVGMLRAQLAAHPLDYIIGSVHFVDRFSVDTAARDWERLSADERNTVWRHYWQRVRQLAESRVYDVVAHLDVPKKYGYRPTVDMLAETEAALDAIAAADMAVEVNTAGWDTPAREAYPAPELLHAAKRRGIPIIIGADGHAATQLLRHFPAARILARDAGYTASLRYVRRERVLVPL